MGRKNYKALILGLCGLAACVKDQPPTPARPVLTTASRVYVVCEGAYGSGNATLYAYEPSNGISAGDLYQSINHMQLGDVFQSMAQIGGHFFLCVNNSNKVVVLDTGSLVYTGTINIPQPRYILPISPTRAYVSSGNDNKVFVIDPSAMQVTDTILLPHLNTEGMCLYNGAAYICAWDTACNSIYKVDANTGVLLQTIQVAGYAPQEVLLDKEQTLWVLSGKIISFNPYDGSPCAWTRIDPSTGDVLSAYHFTAEADVVRPAFNNTKDTLYFIEANQNTGIGNNGIYRMGIYDGALPSQPFVPALANQYFWALGIDPVTGYVYVGDPKGFVQKGSVYVFRQDGVALDTFGVGLGPGHFYFDE